MPYFNVYFEDEAPAIGSGERQVHAVVGTKKVVVSDPHTLRTATLDKYTWSEMRPVELDSRYNRTFKRGIKGALRQAGTPPSERVKRMLADCAN